MSNSSSAKTETDFRPPREGVGDLNAASFHCSYMIFGVYMKPPTGFQSPWLICLTDI